VGQPKPELQELDHLIGLVEAQVVPAVSAAARGLTLVMEVLVLIVV
jgi:hypothetical protein